MWEYRLVWASGNPPWWDDVWNRCIDHIAAQGRQVEQRSDTYLVLLERFDAGLKLRAGNEDVVEIKVLHERADGWELWEKIICFDWNALEALRLSVLLQVMGAEGVIERTTPGKGVAALLAAREIQYRRIDVNKRRIQIGAREVMQSLPICAVNADCLVELVEIELPERRDALFSICLETVQPTRAGIDPWPGPAALRCGYPALLARHFAQASSRSERPHTAEEGQG